MKKKYKRGTNEIANNIEESIEEYLKLVRHECRYVEILINDIEIKADGEAKEVILKYIKIEFVNELKEKIRDIENLINQLNQTSSVKKDHFNEIYNDLNKIFEEDNEDLNIRDMVAKFQGDLFQYNEETIKYKNASAKSKKENKLMLISRELKKTGKEDKEIVNIINSSYINDCLEKVDSRKIKRWNRNE